MGKLMTNLIIFSAGIISTNFGEIIVKNYEVDCHNLRMGQYLCPDPSYDLVDPKTQQIRGCTKENKAKGNFSQNSFPFFF